MRQPSDISSDRWTGSSKPSTETISIESIPERPKRRRRHKKKIPCNPRLDELSRPRKWLVLAVWREFAWRFEPERLEWVRRRVQEEFCMSPEETERYVESLKKKSDSKRRQKERYKELRQEKYIAKGEARTIFKKFLKKAMMFACITVPPPLVSPILRYMSESILILLSEIHGLDRPERTDKSNIAQFLIALSDWAAIFLLQMYYEIDVKEKEELEKLKEMEKAAAEEEEEDEPEERPTKKRKPQEQAEKYSDRWTGSTKSSEKSSKKASREPSSDRWTGGGSTKSSSGKPSKAGQEEEWKGVGTEAEWEEVGKKGEGEEEGKPEGEEEGEREDLTSRGETEGEEQGLTTGGETESGTEEPE